MHPRLLPWLLWVMLTPLSHAQSTDPAQDIRDAYNASSRQALLAMRENEARMQQLIESMRNEMAQLETTKDRKARQQLMSQHRGHLHEMLMLLRQSGGDSLSRIMEQHTRSGRTAQTSSKRTPEDDIRLLTARIDMMQMTLEALLDHVSMQGRNR